MTGCNGYNFGKTTSKFQNLILVVCTRIQKILIWGKEAEGLC